MTTQSIRERGEFTRASTGVLLVCAGLSGAASLIYQVVWNRLFLNAFGSTTAATSSVVAAFMGGLALGAWMFGRYGRYLRRPAVAYAALEVGVAAYALLLPFLLGAVESVYGSAWHAVNGSTLLTAALRQVIGFTVLAIPTAFMGGTLPLMARILSCSDGETHRRIGWLYALNTLGAAAGAAAAGFALLPRLGQSETTIGAMLLNVAAATMAIWFFRRPPPPIAERDVDAARVISGKPLGAGLMAALFVSGFAALGLEVLWTRMLILVAGSSTYAFSLMLASDILGLSLGSWWASRWVDRLRSPGMVFAHLQIGVAAVALVGLRLFGYAPALAFAWFRSAGASFATSLIFDALLAAVLVVPTVLLGAAFPVAVRFAGGGATNSGATAISGTVGFVYAWTALGNVIGALATSTLLIALLGLGGSLKLFAAGSLLSAALIVLLAPGQQLARRVTLGAAGAMSVTVLGMHMAWNPLLVTSGIYKNAPLYLALGGNRVQLADILSGYHLLFYREGPEAVVSVMETPTLGLSRDLSLAIDGKVDASTGRDMSTEILSGHLPMLFARDPHRVLVVGLASGITLGSVEQYPEARHITVAEIAPSVVQGARYFERFNHQALADQRVGLVLDDGRHYLRLTRTRFDVIISEPSNPWMSGPARLFTRDYFEQVREHLSDGGIYAQWLPLYGLSDNLLKDEVRTFLSVFAHAELFQVAQGDTLLLGSAAPIRYDPARIAARLARPAVLHDLQRVDGGPINLFGRFLLGTHGLARWAGTGPVNTDNNGLLEFAAPRYLLVDTLGANRTMLLSVPWEPDLRAMTAGVETAQTLALARAYFALDHLKRAEWLAQEVLAREPSSEADLLLGDIAARKRSWGDARGFWRKAGTPQAQLLLAELALEQDDWQVAARHLNDLPRASHSGSVMYFKALVAMHRGDDRRALTYLDRVTEYEDTGRSIAAAYLQSAVADRLGREDRANDAMRRFQQSLTRLRRRLERDDGNAAAASLMQSLQSPALKSVLSRRERQQLLEQVAVGVLTPIATYYRGVSELWLGQPRDGAKTLEEYLREIPGGDPNSYASTLLARAYRRLGHPEREDHQGKPGTPAPA